MATPTADGPGVCVRVGRSVDGEVASGPEAEDLGPVDTVLGGDHPTPMSTESQFVITRRCPGLSTHVRTVSEAMS